MKKYILILLMLGGLNPILAQDSQEQEYQQTETRANTRRGLGITNPNLSPLIKWSMQRRGYTNFKEYTYNTFGILSFGLPLNLPFAGSNKISQFDIIWSYLEHHKNKFYYTVSFLPSIAWNSGTIFLYGVSLGLGGSFYDSRDVDGKGWLVGMDWENGFQASSSSSPLNDRTNILTGFNFRGLYKGTQQVGVSIAFEIFYRFYVGNSGLPSSSEISIGPKIGLTY